MTKNNLKFKFLFLLVFVFYQFRLQAQDMYVMETNGSQTTHPLKDIKKLTFPNANLLINNFSGVNNSYILKKVRNLSFKDLTLGMNTAQVIKKFSVYPNPVTDVLNILISDPLQSNTYLEVISIEGRVIQKKNINANVQVFQIDVSAFPSGVFFCKITNETNSQTTKFIKQ